MSSSRYSADNFIAALRAKGHDDQKLMLLYQNIDILPDIDKENFSHWNPTSDFHYSGICIRILDCFDYEASDENKSRAAIIMRSIIDKNSLPFIVCRLYSHRADFEETQNEFWDYGRHEQEAISMQEHYEYLLNKYLMPLPREYSKLVMQCKSEKTPAANQDELHSPNEQSTKIRDYFLIWKPIQEMVNKRKAEKHQELLRRQQSIRDYHRDVTLRNAENFSGLGYAVSRLCK